MRLSHIACCFALVVLSIASYILKPTCQVVFFDKKTIHGQLIRQLAERKSTDDQVEEAVRRFNQALSKVLIEYARKNKVVILEGYQIVAGGIDITDEVILKLGEVMRKKS